MSKTNGKTTTKKQAAEVMEALINQTRNTSYGEVQVERRGDKIILPEEMTYPQAHEWLDKIEDSEETVIDIHHEVKCYPLDGAYALYKALMEIYGFVKLERTPGFFGSKPPRMVTVATSVDDFIEVPWGKMSLPGIEGEIYTSTGSGRSLPTFVIGGEIKRKHEGAIRKIIKKTEEIVEKESIYKGKAVRVDLSHIGERSFNPEADAPKFFDVRDTNEEDLILNRQTAYDLQVSIWNRLEHMENLTANGVNLKHGCLLMGTYGVGKTMTAKVTARKAQDNNWTFLYIESPDRFAEALRLAELYAPAVVFVEDIDKVMNGSERDDYMNKVLNTMDGIDTKDQPIVTVLTTNHPEKINKAFLRAGRIDSVVPMGKPEADTAVRFVEHFAGESLVKDADLKEAGKLLAGFVPAFISQAVEKAKQYAISREGKNIKGKVTPEDITGAAETLQSHQDMVAENHQPTDAEKVLQSIRTLSELGYRPPLAISEDEVDDIAEAVREKL